MSKISLTNLVNLENETTAVNAINSNNATLTTAFDNTLSRDGTTPNTMNASLDMNSNQIVNLPAPTSNFSPLRAIDVNTINGSGLTVSPLPTGGTTKQVLSKNSATNFDVSWRDESAELTAGTNIAITGTSPATIATTTTPTFTSVTTPTIVNTGTLTLPTSTDTLVGRNTTDTLTNKSLTSPTLTGTPVAPTATIGTNTTQIATTAFVLANANSPQVTLANSAGFVGDGVTNNDAAFTAWWSGLSSAGGCLEFGKGTYVFSSAINKTMASSRQTVTIRGLGSDLSILHWPSGGGMKIVQGSSLNSVHIRDLTFTTGAANTGSAIVLDSNGIALGSAQLSNVTNVAIRGNDFDDINSNVHYWAVGLQIRGWSNINVEGLTTYGLIGAPGTAGGGIGMNVNGYSTGQSIVINTSNSTFSWHNVGVELDSYWEGLTFNQCNFQGEVGSVGLYCPTGQTNSGPLLNVSGCQFNSGGQQIDMVSAVPEMIVRGCTITVIGNNNFGILHGAGSSPIIVGNLFNVASGTGTTGVSLNCTNGVVGSNIFVGLATGVTLNASATAVNVSQNLYPGVTTQVNNLGTGNSVGVATK